MNGVDQKIRKWLAEAGAAGNIRRKTQQPTRGTPPTRSDPWSGVSAADIKRIVDDRLGEQQAVGLDSGKVFLPGPFIAADDEDDPTGESLEFVCSDADDVVDDFTDVLLSVLTDPRRRGRAKAILEETDVDSAFERFLDEQPIWVVHCSVDSMVSGVWGLKAFAMSGRGYLYYEPDWGEAGNRSIVGAWEPIGNFASFKQCLLEVYSRGWQYVCLPPAMGQWAIGPSEIMQEAVCAALQEHPDSWSDVVDRLPNDQHPKLSFGELVHATSKMSGTPVPDVSKFLRPYCALETLVPRDPMGREIWNHVNFQTARAALRTRAECSNEREARVLVTAFLCIVECGGLPPLHEQRDR